MAHELRVVGSVPPQPLLLGAVALSQQPPVVGRRVFDGGREGTLRREVVSGNERAGPGRVGEVAGELATRVRA
jgi:hypothetical protein